MRCNSVSSKLGIPDVIVKLRSLITVLVGAVTHDSSVGQERHVKRYDRPRDRARRSSGQGTIYSAMGEKIAARASALRDSPSSCRGPKLGTDPITSHNTLPNTTKTDIFCSGGSLIGPTGSPNLTGELLITGGDLTVSVHFCTDDRAGNDDKNA